MVSLRSQPKWLSIYLIEVKDGNKVPSAQALTTPQQIFHRDCQGQVDVINYTEPAFDLIYRAKAGLV